MDQSGFSANISAETATNERSYTIGGVEIMFPYKAYPSQIQMMDKIVKSLTKKQNCLLESPTGSGKSLALLCSALAWQRKFRGEMDALKTQLEEELNLHGEIKVPNAQKYKNCTPPTRVTPTNDVPVTTQSCTAQNQSPTSKPAINIEPFPIAKVKKDSGDKPTSVPNIHYISIPNTPKCGTSILKPLASVSPASSSSTNPASKPTIFCIPPNILPVSSNVPSCQKFMVFSLPQGTVPISITGITPNQKPIANVPQDNTPIKNTSPSQVPLKFSPPATVPFISSSVIVQSSMTIGTNVSVPAIGSSLNHTIDISNDVPGNKSLGIKIPVVDSSKSQPQIQETNVPCSDASINNGSTLCSSNAKGKTNFYQFSFTGKVKKGHKPGIQYIDDDEDFKLTKKQRRSAKFESSFSEEPPVQSSPTLTPKQSDPTVCHKIESVTANNPSANSSQSSSSGKVPDRAKKGGVIQDTPKIFFGTRTHKQIAQIIRELKKTCYKNVRMTILSSRDRTCVHPKVSRADSKKEACDELVDDVNGPGCGFYLNYRRGNISHCNPSSLSEVWDLEDLIFKLKRNRICPYFASRALVKDSDIIFCPYNYLVDPLVRNSLDINLKNAVVIMDEAHNLEDTARQAASFSVTLLQLQDAVNDLDRVCTNAGSKFESYYVLQNMLKALMFWLKGNSRLPDYNAFDSASKIYSTQEMLAILSSIGAGPNDFKNIENCFDYVTSKEEGNQKGDSEYEDKASGMTISLLRGLLVVLWYLYKDEQKFAEHYKCVVSKKKVYKSFGTPLRKNQNVIGYGNSEELSINFWCMYPAVAFSDLKGIIHSLIVTSGTLCPMVSFQSELGMPFQIMFEANHVISNSQMWVGTVGSGPKGSVLNATFHNAQTLTFQDDVGHLVLQICSIVSHGVLCFLPSYGMLDKLTERWQRTGLWDQLLCKKVIVCEPRGASREFEAVIREFYDAIKDTESNQDSSVNGALFLAVCRGKVSEGLDFADNNARAVITVGIPFPNIKDSQVDLKKKYNSMHCLKTDIMSGNEWYETQAFRALNQALGRCIRHRYDFGALIIVDERFQKNPRYIDSLSKWIRKEVNHYDTFAAALDSLSHFSKKSGIYPCLSNDDDDDECSFIMEF